MTDEIIAEFKPNRWRSIWRLVVLVIIMGFLLSKINYDSREWRVADFFFYAGLFCVVVLVRSPRPESMSITISKRMISGPPDEHGKLTAIPLGDVEIVLSRHLRTDFDSFFNRRFIYSSDAKKIVVLCDGFPKGTFEQILDTIVRLQREAAISEQSPQG